jgi:hypothetical protein
MKWLTPNHKVSKWESGILTKGCLSLDIILMNVLYLITTYLIKGSTFEMKLTQFQNGYKQNIFKDIFNSYNSRN